MRTDEPVVYIDETPAGMLYGVTEDVPAQVRTLIEGLQAPTPLGRDVTWGEHFGTMDAICVEVLWDEATQRATYRVPGTQRRSVALSDLADELGQAWEHYLKDCVLVSDLLGRLDAITPTAGTATALVLALLKTLGLDALPDAGTLILYWVSTYAVCLLMATLVQALCFGAHGQFVPLVFGVALSFLGLFSLYLPTALAHLVPSSYFGLLSTVGMNYDQGLGQMSFYMRAWSVPDFLIVVALSAVSYVLSCRAFVRKEL